MKIEYNTYYYKVGGFIFFAFSVLFGFSACIGEDNSDCDTSTTAPIRFIYEWTDEIETIPTTGMRVNLFAADDGRDYGREDIPSTGAIINLPFERMYNGITYSYFSTNAQFRNETSPSSIEAYMRNLTRATYSRAYPYENTVEEPDVLLVDHIAEFTVEDGEEIQTITMIPEDVVITYTFEVRKVRGAQYISDTRGGFYGISASLFLMNQTLSETPSTVMFYATPDADTDRIVGSFKTLGVVGDEHRLAIEILYPSDTNGYILLEWDVHDQVQVSTHIIVEADIDIVPDSETGGGFDATVQEWNDVVVPLDM